MAVYCRTTPREMDRTMTDPAYLPRQDGERIAYRRTEGRGPGILWLGGFHSDMNGIKAQAMAEWAQRSGRALVRFDYFGHGASSGEFQNGTISRWRDDAVAVLDALTEGPQVLVGSSMGGWIAMLLAQARPERIAAMVLVAPAPDFTEDLMWSKMPPDVRRQIAESGRWQYQPEGAEGYPITRALIEDGRTNLVLTKPLALDAPVRILHGEADNDVPWRQGLRLMEVLTGDITFTLVKGADHRMSSAANLLLIERTVEGVLKDIESC
jgi:pimeloyl-ACP methyl ester carboxylesterase